MLLVTTNKEHRITRDLPRQKKRRGEGVARIEQRRGVSYIREGIRGPQNYNHLGDGRDCLLWRTLTKVEENNGCGEVVL